MRSVITSKFQTTIPKTIRKSLKLAIKDTLEWNIVEGKVVVSPVQKKFLEYQNSIKIGKGNITDDIQKARNFRSERFR